MDVTTGDIHEQQARLQVEEVRADIGAFSGLSAHPGLLTDDVGRRGHGREDRPVLKGVDDELNPVSRVRRGTLFAPQCDRLAVAGRNPVDDLQFVARAFEIDAAFVAGLDVLRRDRTIPVRTEELIVVDGHRCRTRLRGGDVLQAIGTEGRELVARFDEHALAGRGDAGLLRQLVALRLRLAVEECLGGVARLPQQSRAPVDDGVDGEGRGLIDLRLVPSLAGVGVEDFEAAVVDEEHAAIGGCHRGALGHLGFPCRGIVVAGDNVLSLVDGELGGGVDLLLRTDRLRGVGGVDGDDIGNDECADHEDRQTDEHEPGNGDLLQPLRAVASRSSAHRCLLHRRRGRCGWSGERRAHRVGLAVRA